MRISLKASLLALLAAGGIAAADPSAEPLASPLLNAADAKKENADSETKSALGECNVCGPRVWANSDYLLWRIKDAPISQTVATSSNVSLFPALGQPGTNVLYGPQNQSLGWFSGGRLTIGGWLNDSRTIGLEGSAFLLEERTAGATFQSGPDGLPVIGFPVSLGLGADGGSPFFGFGIPVSIPGLLVGGISVASSTQLWGAEANMVASIRRSDRIELRAIAGFRHLTLDESLNITGFASTPFAPLSIVTSNYFGTQNRFFGGQFGGQGRLNLGRFFLDGTMKVALGSTIEQLSINGNTAINVAGASFNFPASVYASGSNIGTSRNTRFAVVPEVGAKVGVRLTDNISAFVGYTFIYWSDVARPGEQVDTRLSLGAFPQRNTQSTDLFVHGVSFGGEVRF